MNDPQNQPALLTAARFVDGALRPIALTCFIGTLLCDLAYLKTYLGQWETFSIWLLTAGCIVGGFAVAAEAAAYGFGRRRPQTRTGGMHLVLSMLIFSLSVLNALIHSRDGYTAVSPSGVTLSTIVVVLLLINGTVGWGRAWPSQAGNS